MENPNLKNCQDLVVQLAKTGRTEDVRTILFNFGVTKTSELDEKHYASFYKKTYDFGVRAGISPDYLKRTGVYTPYPGKPEKLHPPVDDLPNYVGSKEVNHNYVQLVITGVAFIIGCLIGYALKYFS